MHVLTFSPALMVQSIPLSTRSSPSRYLVWYPLNSTTPCSGQESGGSCPGMCRGASSGISWTFFIMIILWEVAVYVLLLNGILGIL